MLSKQWIRFDFLKKKFEIFIFGRGRVKVKAQPCFQGQPVCSKFKLKFFAGIHLFGLKTTSHGKSDLKNEFLFTVHNNNFKFFFKKIKPNQLLVLHVKGQPAASKYVREKGYVTFDTYRGTPCSY